MCIIMGVDQSYTSTGICIIDSVTNVIIHSGIYRTSNSDDIYDRASLISSHLVDLAITHNVEFVAIEGLAFGIRGDATRDLAGLQFVIITEFRKSLKDIRVNVITPKSLKKFATGKGSASKTDMINALPEDLRTYFISQGFLKTKGLPDVTDAYFLAKYNQAELKTNQNN